MTASDASSLEKIFEGISSTVPAPVNDKLDEKTVITDTLSDYFTFALTEDGKVDVKVYAIDANGNEKESADAAKVKPVVTGKTVTVTDYDFSKHYQGIGDDDEETLVIEIKVKPSGKGCATAKIPTNEGDATVTLDNKEIDKATPPTVGGYSVEYVIDDGASWPNNNAPAMSYYPQDADVAVTDNVPTREGYKFTGWEITAPKDGETTLQNGKFTMPAADVTLTAQWTVNEYTLSYEPNDGTISENASYTNAGKVAFGTALNTPKVADMTKEGYTFEGWYSDAGLTDPAPDAMPAKDLTLYAKWEKNTIPTYKFDLSNLNIIKVDKKFVSKYGRSAEKSFTATVTIEKEETYTAVVDPDFPLNPNVTNNGSAVTAEPTYIGKATGTVTLKTGKTTKAFDFGKESKFQLEPGDYRITVEETKGGDRYVTYDDATYTYEFTVDNEGKINIDTPITCTFTNKYTKRHSAATPSKPTLNTGDHYAYVMGYPDGTVRPNGSITRAEVSTILFRLLSDKTRDEYFTTESSFTDVKAGAWYNNSIATLEKAGVIVDTAKGGAFRPNEAITRAELAAMLAQFSDAKPVKGVKFSDVSAEHWAYEAIAIAAKMGWIEGYPDGTFRPDATITRAEMMTLVNRALDRVPSDEDHLLSKRVMLTFPDCKSGDWFYIAVQEATNSHTYERAATEKNGDEQWTALRANRDWTLLEK